MMKFCHESNDIFVLPGHNRSKAEYPYSYDPFYIWRLSLPEVKKSVSVYSDRMSQWDHQKFVEATKSFPKRFDQFSRQDCSEFLTRYFEKPIEATALAEGCNVSNGYPYWIFFYIEKPEKKSKSNKVKIENTPKVSVSWKPKE